MNHPLKFLLALLLAGFCHTHAQAQLYVVYSNAGLVSEYDADNGALINETLILGLSEPHGICYADGALYIVQRGNGSIGKYDARTGRAINPSLVTGLNMPQTVAVSGDVLYVGGFDDTRQGESFGQIGKYNAMTGATMNPALIAHVPTPTGLAVSGDKLLVTYGGGVAAGGRFLSGVCAYDATNGAMISDHFVPAISSTQQLVVLEHELWVVSGGNAPMGAIFKFDADAGALDRSLNLARPITLGLDYPTGIAVSGDDMYITSSHGTVGKYNAHTGEVIKPQLIPQLGDRIGGIAVVPNASSGAYAMHNAKFATKRAFSDFALVMLSNENYLFLGVGAVVALMVVALFAFFLRRGPSAPMQVLPQTVAPKVGQGATVIAPANRILPPPYVPRTSVPTPAPSTAQKPHSLVRLMMVGIGIVVVTFIATAIAGYMVYMWALSNHLVVVNNRDTSDLVGIWQSDNDDSRLGSEMPFFHDLEVYRTHMEYSVGHGSVTVKGQWRDRGFWCERPDGAGLVEVAQLIDPENIELHVSAFDPANEQVEVLYKQEGSEAEVKEIAARFPPPIVYPPPAGLIRPGMTEYALKSLPWKPDSLTRTGEEKYDQALIYSYHSDNPRLDPLQVTVKNRRVVLVHGGNG